MFYDNLKKFIFIIKPCFLYLFLFSCIKYILTFFGDLSQIDTIIFLLFIPIIFIFYKKHCHNLKSIKNTDKNYKLYSSILCVIISFCIICAFLSKNSFSYTNSLTLLLNTVVLAPICEEFIYRIFVFERCTKYLNLSISIIFTSILFACAHLGTSNLILSFLAGFIFQITFLATNSIITSIVIHSLRNFLLSIPNFYNLNNTIFIIGIVVFIFSFIKLLTYSLKKGE